MSIKSMLTKPPGLGALEYVARLALVPLIALYAWAGLSNGWSESWNAAAILFADVLLAVRWRQFGLFGSRAADPGGSLAPLTKLVMVGSLLLVPLMLRDSEWLTAGLVTVMSLASAGLWLRWRWSLWAWVAYSAAAMADWVSDAAVLFRDALRSDVALPMAELKPLLSSLPSALFAIAILVWVLEWRQRTFPRKQ
jgi:hypothetical protein